MSDKDGLGARITIDRGAPGVVVCESESTSGLLQVYGDRVKAFADFVPTPPPAPEETTDPHSRGPIRQLPGRKDGEEEGLIC